MYENKFVGDAAPSVKKSATEGLLDELRATQDGVHEVVSRLEVRLSVVLGPSYPEPTGTEKSEVATSSPLCNELESRVQVERGVSYRLNKIIDRLTV